MKKSRHSRSLITFSLFIIAFFALAFTAISQAGGQEQTTYKVGDRVEVDPQGMDLGPNKTWRKATVTKIGPVGGGVHGFFVTVDAEGDSGPQDVYVRTGANMIRPLQEAEKNDTKPDAGVQEKKTEPQKEQKTTAANTCPPSDEVKGKTQTDIFKTLILDQYVHKSKSEQDPNTTVTFQTLKVGDTHSWRPGVGGYSPDGPGGKAGTTVYPVKAVFTVCTDVPGYKPSGFRGWTKSHQDETTFYCFKNQFGEYQCNLDASTKTEEKYVNK
jgi:hypothetical protein